tara:strand:+ start:2322 stop:2426 length:105 start_codon:yes stop_codon:yes gene_type:complete
MVRVKAKLGPDAGLLAEGWWKNDAKLPAIPTMLR